MGWLRASRTTSAIEARRHDIETALADTDSPDYIANEARRAQFLEDRDEYRSHNVFWVPAEARWESIQSKAKLPEIGQAMDARVIVDTDLPWRTPLGSRRFRDEPVPHARRSTSA